MSNYSYNKNFFNKIDNEVKAYWLGFLYADGCITRFYKNEKLKAMSLEITLKKEDEGHLFRFLRDLESNVPIKNKKVNGHPCCKLVINCTKMCRDLITLGCTPQKTLTLTFPSEEIVPKEFVRDFIRGYFDGDGCVYFGQTDVFHKNRNKTYNQKHFSISFVGTPDILNGITGVLFNNGISVGSKWTKSGKVNSMYIYGKDNIFKFYKYLYDNSTLYLKRKNEKFQYAFSKFNIF